MLQNLISTLNAYINKYERNSKWVLLKSASELVRDTLFSMGLCYNEKKNDSSETDFDKLVDKVVEFRKNIKNAAQNKDFEKLFEYCDKLRNEDLVDLGIKVEDKGNDSIWKKQTAEEIRVEIAAKLESLHLGKEEKPKKIIIPPHLMFKDDPAFNKFKTYQLDLEGIPFAKDKGEPISDKDREYCVKQFQKRKGEFEKIK